MDLYKSLSPLGEGQIRLLQVSEWSKTASSELTCRLYVACLRDRPSYSALSYTWGFPFPHYGSLHREKNVLACNGTRISVKPNLYDFLLHCSKHPDESFRGPIWVDALCINQNDHQERSKQVQLIGDIYKAAGQVIVWLGIEEHNTASAAQLIRELAATDPAVRSARILQLHSMPSNEDTLTYRERWHAVANFFERNWFERAWIIQEITFARKSLVLCGPHILKWDDITNVSKLVATAFSASSIWSNYFEEASNADTESSVSVRIRCAHFPAKLAATKSSKAASSGDGLLFALIRSRRSKCEDPRDKVYSQLRLGNAKMFPTYDDDTVQVYITAATYILQHSDNLLLLTCVEGSDFQKLPGLPSWVPDWSVTKDLGLRITGYRHFNAAGSLSRRLKIMGGGRQLQVQAARIDTTVRGTETKGELLDFSRPTSLWDMVAEVDNIYAPTGQGREEVLWRTLTTNRENTLHTGRIQYPSSKTPLEDSFAQWVLWRYLAATRTSPVLESSTFPIPSSSDSILPTREAILEFIKTSSLDDRATLENEASVFHSHYSYALFLKLFRTQKGFLGLGTQSLREGDSVWVVPGCRVLLIFREVDQSYRYRLVGGSYMHGFMDGEASSIGEEIALEMVELE